MDFKNGSIVQDFAPCIYLCLVFFFVVIKGGQI